MMKFFLSATVVLFSCSFAYADTVPAELIGSYGDSPAQCRSYHRKSDDVTKITANSITWCPTTFCEMSILAVRKMQDGGYRIKLQGGDGPYTKTLSFVAPGVFESDGKALVKCSEQDKISGIGLPNFTQGALTKAPAVMFSALYALAVPASCSNLQVDREQAERLASIGLAEYLQFIKSTGEKLDGIWAPEAIADRQKKHANFAASEDAREIHDFCKLVLDAYGADGALLPNLISDGSKPL